jgi:hypothetical protein
LTLVDFVDPGRTRIVVARETAFLRSMAERGDMTVLYEPFCNLKKFGLPFIPRALAWEPGQRPEWRRSAR